MIGKEVPVQHVDDSKYAEIMTQAGIPDFVVPMLVAIQKDIREGTLDIESNDFEKLLGRSETPVVDGVRKLISNS